MALDAIAAGAVHLVWYGASVLQPSSYGEDAEIWQGVCSAAELVSSISGALQNPRVPIGSDQGVAAAGFRMDGGLLVVVSNRSVEDLQARLTLDRPYSAAADVDSGGLIEYSGDTEIGVPLRPGEARLLILYDCGS